MTFSSGEPMKPITVVGLVVCVLLIGTVLTRETKLAHADERESTEWKQLRPGISVQRLWGKDEWPQVAVLKVSNDMYQKFTRNPADFINTNKIFPVSVQDPTGANVSAKAPQESGGVWLVVLVHGKTSTCYSAAVPEPPEQDQ
jgi:hypothetical protein